MGLKVFTPILLRRLPLLATVLFLSGSLFAEGTKQLAPSSTDTVGLMINNSAWSSFARYDGTEEERLYIKINDPENEQVFLGFSQPYSSGHNPAASPTTAYFRIKDPEGNIVYGPTLLDASSSNISNWSQAVAGPSNIAGGSGYTPFVFDPSGLTAGEYYIEFNADITTYTTTVFFFQNFDITVATTDPSPAAIDGRVYALNWAFWLPTLDLAGTGLYNYFDRPFNGSFYVYTPEGYVSKVDFANSNLQPVAFNIAFNSTGTGNTGDVCADRMSLDGVNSTTPEYPVFLNDPDITLYPSGTFGQILSDSTELVGCAQTGLFFKVATTKVGVVEILLDQDQATGVGVYDPGTADRLLAIYVDEQDSDTDPNIRVRYIPWDGLDGLGATVSTASPIPTKVIYSQGSYHLPIYDAEYHLNGMNASIHRPTPPSGYTILMYWDDSNIVDASGISGQNEVETQGCTSNCHRWNNGAWDENANFGNLNTINTYWYASQLFQTINLTLVPECGEDSDGDGNYDIADIDWDNDGIPNEWELCNNPTGSDSGSVTLFIQLDNYPSETTWDFRDASNNILYSGGPYPDGTYAGVLLSGTLPFAGGDFTFNIYDSYGDGNCCSYGIGYHYITVNGTTYGNTSNGAFVSQNTLNFSIERDYGYCLTGDPTLDNDNDGILDYKDADFCTLNSAGVCISLDMDNDGIPSFLDLDSDNDGIPDIIEAGGTDSNNDGVVDYATPGDALTMADTDNDGLADAYDPDQTTSITLADTDGDKIPDAYDLDSDNDGLADIIEVGGVDTDGDGIADDMATPSTGDLDGNGWSDIISAATLVDQSLSDNAIDFDGDNLANHLDIDSDNDGITDVKESGAQDGNADGLADDGSGGGTITDANNDGWDDNYDGGVMTSTADGGDVNTIADFLTGTGNPDFDSDGLPNWLDIDADDDGLVDNNEGQATAAYISPTTDSDGDGLNDAYEVSGTIGSFGGAGISPVNTNSIGEDDYLDNDTDSDGEGDIVEGHDTNGDGTVNGSDSPNANTGLATGTDSDQDGLDDGFDNNISSSDPTNGSLTPSSYADADNAVSAERDWRETSDIDLDNDGIANAREDAGTGFDPIGDADGDGTANYLDSSDATASFPSFTDTNNDGINDIYDADLDGIPNFLDLDADNDGIPDIVEAGGVDTNGDGRVDDATDTDGDGLVDDYDSNCVGGGCSGATTGTDIAVGDSDGDNLADYLDLDADNDGIPDLVEAGGIDTNGDGRVDVATDGDGDGLADAYDENASDGPGAGGTDGTALVETNTSGDFLAGGTGRSLDNDGDGYADLLDLDSDNDGIPDIVEAGASDPDNDGMVDTGALPWDADGDGLADVYDENTADGPAGTGSNGTALVETTADTNSDSRVNASGERMIGSNVDVDNDTYPNHLDLDADNDGITDVVENASGDSAADHSGGTLDGIVGDNASVTDTNNDGWHDPSDSASQDSDGDGLPDYLDIDADNDGIPDYLEGVCSTCPSAIVPTGPDTDGNGVLDIYEDLTSANTNSGTNVGVTPNLDDDDNGVDMIADYLDTDSDGDGAFDWTEGFDNDMDGNALNDLIGMATTYASNNGGNAGPYDNSVDSDSDNIPDWLDNQPLVSGYSETGRPPFLDASDGAWLDSDNNGLVDLFDAGQGGTLAPVPNANGGDLDWRDNTSEAVLPIELLGFWAKATDCDVALLWNVGQQDRFKGFVIERSNDLSSFIALNEIAYEPSMDSYRFQDGELNGTYYYRLKMVDLDGQYKYSDVKVVEAYCGKKQPTVTIYPNPVVSDKNLIVSFTNYVGLIKLTILDYNGKVVKKLDRIIEGNGDVSIVVRDLPEGTYFLQYVNGNKRGSLNFMKLR